MGARNERIRVCRRNRIFEVFPLHPVAGKPIKIIHAAPRKSTAKNGGARSEGPLKCRRKTMGYRNRA